MDFGFLRASTADYKVLTSCDGFQSYLVVVDKHTLTIWVFLTKPKDPLVDTVKDFLKRFG